MGKVIRTSPLADGLLLVVFLVLYPIESSLGYSLHRPTPGFAGVTDRSRSTAKKFPYRLSDRTEAVALVTVTAVSKGDEALTTTTERVHRTPTNNQKPNGSTENQLSDQWWEETYWFRKDIHTLGNTGVLGGLHAAMAPLSTKMIDLLAYNGKNVRQTIANDLSNRLLSRLDSHQKNPPSELRVLDLGCGVGVSTLAIASAFRQQKRRRRRTGFNGIDAGEAATPRIPKVYNATIIGVDTSPEMIAMARAKDRESRGIRMLSRGGRCYQRFANVSTSFVQANAEATPFPNESFDLVTIQYVLHEVPFAGRHRIMREARRLLKPGGILAVVDISPDYQPSPSMLSGEPFVLEYQQNFRKQLRSLRGCDRQPTVVVVPGHVVLHVLTRADRGWHRGWWHTAKGWIFKRAAEFSLLPDASRTLDGHETKKG